MNAQTATRERPQIADMPQLAPTTNIVTLPEPRPSPSYPPKLAKTLMAITREFGAITKATKKNDPNGGGWNDFHNYGYQKWDDVLDRESTLFQQHGIILQQSEIARSLLDKLISITYEFTIISEEGEVWPDRPVFTAIGRLQDHKGIFDDKAANKCHTQAHKYFLLHTFKIKTKDVAEEDADGAADEVQTKQIDRPKPPRPGSAEAMAADEPCTINPQGMSYQVFADTFIAAIEHSAPGDVARWVELNQASIDKVKGGKVAQYERIEAAINKLSASPAENAAPKPPKPPRPGATAPAVKQMPDASTEPEAFITWLKEKMDGFESYEQGETYWNETIQALDLGGDVQEDAMSVWRSFERKHEG